MTAIKYKKLLVDFYTAKLCLQIVFTLQSY